MRRQALQAGGALMAAAAIFMFGGLAEVSRVAAGTESAGGSAPGTSGSSGPCAMAAQVGVEVTGSATATEVKRTVIENFRLMRDTSKSQPESYSALGSLEFWSSGGLMMEIPPEGLAEEFEIFNLYPKHITVIPLVPDQAAVALFYMEGSLHPKGGNPVGRYLTRVTQVFVNEDGRWRIRSSHWSPLTGGAGTNQVTVEQ